MNISEDINTVILRLPDNWHAHFRQEKLLEFLVPYFVNHGWRRRVVGEPNTLPAILTGPQAVAYKDSIEAIAKTFTQGQYFELVMTIQITESTTPKMVREAFACGVRIVKIYPRYVTTHSENGVLDYLKIYPALHVVAELGMVAQFHSEHPSYDVIGRLKESAFRAILSLITAAIPSLKISVEHVSSRDMVEWVKDQGENVGAGVTVQHIYLTSDDLSGYSRRSKGKICVHTGAFKPGAKDPEDRAAIQEVILSGHPRFWYAGDDAAHLLSAKQAPNDCPCGVWVTIPALSLVLSFFESRGKLEKAEPFLSEFGARFYGYELNEGELVLRRSEWIVPTEVPVPALNDSIIPFFAGEKMDWQIVA